MPPVKQPTGSPGPGSRVALRNWRISTRLVSLLALPVVAATSLGALRISDSMTDIQQLDNMKLLTDMTKQATELATALQEERDQSAGPLSHGGKATDYQVKGYQQKTDRARDNFINASEEVDSASKSGNLQGVRESLVGLATELDNLDKIRKSAYQSKENSTQTVDAYHRLITQLLDLSQDMAEATSNPEMIQRTRALAAFSAAKEFSSVQRAVIAAALPNNNTQLGKLSDNDRLYADSALESEKSELSIFRNIYGTQGAEELIAPIEDGNPTIESADTYAQRVLDNANGLSSLDKRSYKDWVDDSSTKIEQMKKIEHTLLEDMEQKARELRSASEREAIISGALILLVLGVSLVGAFVIARSMIRSLRRLQETANKVAQDRLPELVKQLSESDPQDVDTSVESVGVHSRDEIGQVAAAFDDVHREAVRLAAEQALLRGNVNAMFTNLSRRSQGLIQRQLSLISELESREADPDQLSSLFKLDHLATRMRRNGENLLVLAGEEPGRRWTRPVPLVDVLRAAASEVEQYERIELASVPTTEVAGRVVNDLVHLLAELLENATSFSSPQTKVKVTGHALPDGRVLIEIHDTGIGLSPRTSPRSTSGWRRRPPWTSRSPAAWVCSWSAACRSATASHPAAPLRLRWYDRAGHAPRRRRPGRQEARSGQARSGRRRRRGGSRRGRCRCGPPGQRPGRLRPRRRCAERWQRRTSRCRGRSARPGRCRSGPAGRAARCGRWTSGWSRRPRWPGRCAWTAGSLGAAGPAEHRRRSLRPGARRPAGPPGHGCGWRPGLR